MQNRELLARLEELQGELMTEQLKHQREVEGLERQIKELRKTLLLKEQASPAAKKRKVSVDF